MKVSLSTMWIYGLLVLMTAGYCLSIEFGAWWIDSLINTYFKTPGPELPIPAYLFIHSDSKGIWQILALFSLIGNMIWGFIRANKSDHPDPHLLPAICHLSWVVTWAFFHLIGFALPFFKLAEPV